MNAILPHPTDGRCLEWTKRDEKIIRCFKPRDHEVNPATPSHEGTVYINGEYVGTITWAHKHVNN